MFSIMLLTLQYQVFSIAEFDFCYNYVYYRPFQEKTQIVLSNQFTFDDATQRDLCTRIDNVIFREINQSTFSIRIDSEFNLSKQPFSLFFFVWTNVTIFDTQISMKLSNSSSSDFSFLVASAPEYSIKILQSSFSFTSNDAISSFYGVANNLTEFLTLNRSSYVFSCSTPITKFFGISSSLSNLIVVNSSFIVTTGAVSSYGFAQLITVSAIFKNLTISGILSGANTFGFIYENRGACIITDVNYSLVTKGTVNCGFVQIGSGSVSTANIIFNGFANNALISEPSLYTGVCPCITGSVLQNGLCYCATGSLPVSNNCSCTVLKSFIQNQVCVCPAGASNVGGICTCTTGATMVGNTCVCTAGATLTNGVCVCTSGATLTGGICICTTGATLSNGICVCVTNAVLTNGLCVCQPANSQLTAGVCKCIPAYSIMSGSACTCTPQYTTMVGSVCTCPAGASLINGNCVCTTGATMTNGVCVCTSGATLTNGICVCCAGASLTGTVCVCNKAGSTLSGGKCVCTKDYTTGLYWNGGNYYCSNMGVCCSTRDSGPSFKCSDGKVYWSGCTKSSYVT
ncbi:Conserved_hypothetical protein [Hexamita inflata]|uniref:Uncharacterized protein n=1 Tax=Hexamita inflata TaxID=28002 RepID=A0AA86RA99_9EUKA|nr:Conserved hypothetical protein [Hexamita inflata]